MKENLEQQIEFLKKAQVEAFNSFQFDIVKSISDTIFNYLTKLEAYK